jgi:hypothetical protein
MKKEARRVLIDVRIDMDNTVKSWTNSPFEF